VVSPVETLSDLDRQIATILQEENEISRQQREILQEELLIEEELETMTEVLQLPSQTYLQRQFDSVI
jgi:hypothetical protein